MKKINVLALSLFIVLSCKKEGPLTFTEINVLHDDNAVIELNIPKANQKTSAGISINKSINNHIANMLNFSEEDSKTITLEGAIKKFQEEYTNFKADFKESALVWEATFDGEVIYKSEEIITIALSSYTNTGGAHGNTSIALYNFNPQTGKTYSFKDIVKNEVELTSLAKTYFVKESQLESDSSFEDFFFGEDFHLPANIGFNDEGLLMLYNVYEVSSYDQNITEFTIPFDSAKSFLHIY